MGKKIKKNIVEQDNEYIKTLLAATKPYNDKINIVREIYTFSIGLYDPKVLQYEVKGKKQSHHDMLGIVLIDKDNKAYYLNGFDYSIDRIATDATDGWQFDTPSTGVGHFTASSGLLKIYLDSPKIKFEVENTSK